MALSGSRWKSKPSPRMPAVAFRKASWHSQPMNTAIVEPAFAELLREIQSRKAKNPPVAKAGWEQIFGTMPDNEASREAARLGEEWRRSEGLSE